jgi:hypothetical protein
LFEPSYASFYSSTTQSTGTTNPALITFDGISIGTTDISTQNPFPDGVIVLETAGVYRIIFSAQCESSSGNHYLEIFPVIDGTSLPDSNTRIALTNNTEACLVVEYIVSVGAFSQLELFTFGDNTNAQLIAFTGDGTKTPPIPDTPSIILNIHRIA